MLQNRGCISALRTQWMHYYDQEKNKPIGNNDFRISDIFRKFSLT